MKTVIKVSKCTQCGATGTLAARLVPVDGHGDWLESLIECEACHARTHAAFTNVELEAEATSIQNMFDPVKRGRAQKAFQEKFDAFNKAVLDALLSK